MTSMEELVDFFNDNERTKAAYNTVRLGLQKPEQESISVREIVIWTNDTTTTKNFISGLHISIRMLLGGKVALDENTKRARSDIINTLINNGKVKGLC
tara:strand:- start:45 stop:338 length:294 start_codon:yes stop_codon:yes gene_type:complete